MSSRAAVQNIIALAAGQLVIVGIPEQFRHDRSQTVVHLDIIVSCLAKDDDPVDRRAKLLGQLEFVVLFVNPHVDTAWFLSLLQVDIVTTCTATDKQCCVG